MVKRLYCFIFAIVFAIMFGATYVVAPIYASADDMLPSSVLDDLSKDGNFDESKYPLNYSDTTLSVIQIAESTDGELLIYVYQPSGSSKDYRASSINISTELDEKNPSYRNYALEYLNSSDSLYKYRVKNFVVSDSDFKRYDISSVYRPWDKDVDKPAEGENITTEKAFRVAQRWNLMNTSDGVVYSMQQIDVVEIVDKYVGYMHYENGFYLFQNSCDSHFVAFSTDWNMDNLFEVELDYYITPYTHKISWYPSGFGVETSDATYATDEPQHVIQIVDHLQTGEYSPYGWIGKKYSWDRIRTAKEFADNENEHLTDESKERLKNKQWVVTFTETPTYFSSNVTGTSGVQVWTFSRVEELTILRLKFESDGDVYNLGVVDNKTSEGVNQSPDGIVRPDDNWWAKLIALIITVIIIAVIVIILAVLAPWILSAIVNFLIAVAVFIGKGLLWLLKGLWWLISRPFVAIGSLFTDE